MQLGRQRPATSVLAVCGALLIASFALPKASADEARDAFVEANILAIFYHELGHAVIDQMDVPIFGQEEDAADVLSVMLIDWLFEEETAQAIAHDSAFGYFSDLDQTDVAYWDVHGPDEQRYYNHICLFYEANPDEREAMAINLGLPEERAETCPEEYDQAASSWGVIFDEMDEAGGGRPVVFEPGVGDDAAVVNDLLRLEVESLNGDLNLPRELVVRVESCGEANAFYDPNDASITMCVEFVPHLQALHSSLISE